MKLKTYIICVILFAVSAADQDCSLEKLYKDIDVQLVLREHLSNLFENKFIHVVNSARRTSPYLIVPAHHFKRDLKKYFIEFGEPFNTTDDLEKLLKRFKFLEIPEFRLAKHDHDLRKDFIVD